MIRARRMLAQKLNREPTLRELAKESGFAEAKVRDLLELIEDPISLETPVGDGESIYGDLIEDVQRRPARGDDRGEHALVASSPARSRGSTRACGW